MHELVCPNCHQPFSIDERGYAQLLEQVRGEMCIRDRTNSEKWEEYLTKWLVAVVANAMDDKQCRNHTCLVLTGEQGKFKTTFLDLLLSLIHIYGATSIGRTNYALCPYSLFGLPRPTQSSTTSSWYLYSPCLLYTSRCV